MPESRNRDLATSLGQAVKNNTITSTGSLAVVGLTAYDSAGLLPSSYDSSNAGTLGFAEDSDKLYIHTGQGWFNIAIINTTPIFTTSPSSVYALETDATAYKNGTATVITLAARDSEGFPVTFSATGDTAFNNIAYVDKDSANGFIFTVEPKSQDSVGEAAPANGTLTFSVTDGINTASTSSTFSLLFDQSVANSEGTTFFLGASGNNSNNSPLTADESDSPHTLSIATDPSGIPVDQTQTTSYSPFAPIGYSVLLGGISDNGNSSLAEGTRFIKYKNGTHFAFGAPSGNSNDFTVEGWYYSTRNSANTRNLFDFRGSATSNLNIALEINSADGRLIARTGSTAAGITGDATKGSHASTDGVFKDFEWNHIAWVRNATTSKIYINGCECMSFTDNNNYVSAGSGGDNYFVLGRTCPGNTSATDDARYVGYVRDFRVVKGSAVYTANFAPPTAPLQRIANTELLICNKPYMQGMSAEGAPGKGKFMSASTGPVSDKIAFVAFSPYKIQNQWDATKHGGSLNRFSRLQASGHADFQFGTSTDFTVEFWFVDRSPTGDYNNDVTILDTRTSSGNGWYIYLDHQTSGHIVRIKYGTTSSSTLLISSTIDIDEQIGAWNHIAFTREGSTHKLYHNGEQVAVNSSTSVNWNSSGTFYIGSNVAWSKPIYIGPMRIVKGTAVYTGNFYPPTGPFTKTGSTYQTLKDPGSDGSTTVDNTITASETVFLANWAPGVGDRAGMASWTVLGQLQDQSPRIYDGPVGNTGSQKYSVPSVLWDKTDYEFMELGNSPLDHIMFPNIYSNEAFTFEGWVQWSGTAETQNGLDPTIALFQQGADVSNAGYSGLYADVSNSGKLQMTIGSSVSSTGYAVEFSNISGANLLDGNWHHIVLCRQKQNGRMSLYADGVRHSGGLIYTGRLAATGYKGFGGGTYDNPPFRYTGGWNGNMSQMRLKKGVTVYPQNIRKETLTPTTAFNSARTVGNSGGDTKLITCHAATLTDGSASSHTITAVGDAAVSNWAPNGGMKSVYFDGTGDYLTVPDSADWNMGSGAMTAEAWVWIESYQSHALVVGQWTSSLAWSLQFSGTTGYVRYQFYNGSSYTDATANNTQVPLQTWTHVALIKTGSYAAAFVNGDLVKQTSTTVHPQDSTSVLSIGGKSSSQKFKGYISNVRVTKGSFLYNVDFTPPSEAMYG